jgi:hypothetical protein
MLIVSRCLGWPIKGTKVHPNPRIKHSGEWLDYIPELVIASTTYTDTICPLCQKAMEKLYSKPLEELIEDANEMENEQKGQREAEEKAYDDFVERTIDQKKED